MFFTYLYSFTFTLSQALLHVNRIEGHTCLSSSAHNKSQHSFFHFEHMNKQELRLVCSLDYADNGTNNSYEYYKCIHTNTEKIGTVSDSIKLIIERQYQLMFEENCVAPFNASRLSAQLKLKWHVYVRMCASPPRVGPVANARGDPLSGCDFVVVAEQKASTGVPVAVSRSLRALKTQMFGGLASPFGARLMRDWQTRSWRSGIQPRA